MVVHPEGRDELLTPAGVAALLYVDPKTVTRWAAAGKLAAIRTPGGHRRYLRSEVMALLSGLHPDQRRERDAGHGSAETLDAGRDRLRLLVDAVTDYAIITLDADGIIESWNTGAQRLKGYTPEEALGRHFSILYPAEDRRAGLPLKLLDRARTAGRCEHAGWRVRKDGSQFWGDIVISAVHDERYAVTGFVKVVRDLTDQHRLEAAQDIYYHAFEHDVRLPITAIKSFAELVGDADPEDHAYLLQRIDANADRLLSMVEELIDYARLRSGLVPINLQTVDLMALAQLTVANLASVAETTRVQIAAACSVPVLADPEALERAVANLVSNALTYSPDGSEVNVSCEQLGDVGVLRIVDQGRGLDERDLDSILLEFERGRRTHEESGAGVGLASVRRLIGLQGGTVEITTHDDVGTTATIQLPLAPGPHQRHHSSLGLESELRLALEEKVTQFVLHYQPVVDLVSGRVTGVEALAHWQHPVRGLLAPEQFIALAEATGLTHQLGTWALDQAVRDASTLTREGRKLDMAVQVSLHQPEGQLVAAAQRALASSGLDPERLILEVTESSFVEDEGVTTATCEALSQLGVKIAIVDFGTGASSLLHLRRHPVAALRIDGTLVAGIGESADDGAICESIISLAGAVGVSTVAEGIETAAQYAVLRSLGCQRGQGSWWSPAVPIDELGTAIAGCHEVRVPAPRSRPAPAMRRPR